MTKPQKAHTKPRRPRLTRVRRLFGVGFLPLVMWTFCFGMYFSFGLLLTACSLMLKRQKLLIKHRFLLLLLLLLALPVGSLEAAKTTNSIACRVKAAHGDSLPSWCPNHASQITPSSKGVLLKPTEKWAISTFNVAMAAGGWLAGFREVAWETWMLDWGSPDRASLWQEPMKNRTKFCGHRTAEAGPTFERESDFAMQAPLIREDVNKMIRLGQERRRLQPLRLSRPKDTTLRVWLALAVPGAKLEAQHTKGSSNITWIGGIQYPNSVIWEKIVKTPWGKERVALDEALFCAMQIDGAFVPFTMKWHWSVSR